MGNFKRKLANKLGVNENKIKNHNLRWYYMKEPQLCCKYNLKPIEDNIGPYEFSKAANYLKDYFKGSKTDYFNNLVKTADGLSENILDKNPDQNLDHLVYEYVKFRPNTYVITLWPSTNSETKFNELMTLLKKHGNIYYIRKFKLSYNAAKNLIFQLYSDVWRLSTEDKIEEKLEYVGWKKNEMGHFKIVVFDHTSDVRISGGQAPLKEEIRNIWAASYEGRRGDDFLHINDHFYQTVEYCKLYLIRNSLIALHNQNLSQHLSPKFQRCRVYTNTVKNWLVNNIEPVDLDRFVFFGSTNMYAHGIRPCRDVDGHASEYPKPDKTQTKNFVQKVNSSLSNHKTGFFFAGVPVVGSETWKDSWDEKDKGWFEMVGVSHRDELIFNPEYHFFHNGLKYTTLKVDVFKRVIRSRFSDFVDLLQIKLLTGVDFKMPPIPKKYTKEEFLKLTEEYLEKKYENLNKKQIMEILGELQLE